MIRLFQKVGVFYASKFEAAVKAMQQSCQEPWSEKVSEQQKNQLWALYKQATEGDKTQAPQTTKSGKYPNMGSPMTSFRSMEGRQTVQGATQGDILKQELKSEKRMSENKTYFNQNAQNTTGDGMTPRTQEQTLQKASDKFSQGSSSVKGNPQKSNEGYGNRTGQQTNTKRSSVAGSPQDQERNGMWNFNEGKSKEDAQDQYVKLAKSILERNKAEKYLKDL